MRPIFSEVALRRLLHSANNAAQCKLIPSGREVGAVKSKINAFQGFTIASELSTVMDNAAGFLHTTEALDRKCALLRETLLSAKDHLTNAIRNLQSDRKGFEDKTERLEDDRRDIKKQTQSLHKCIEYLNTQEHEEIIPPVTREHEWKPLKPTPKFKIAMTTPYPIKKVRCEIPKTSSWPYLPEYGESSCSNHFIAILRSKRASSAKATIGLHGWR